MLTSKDGVTVMFLRNKNQDIEVWAGATLVDTLPGRRQRLPGLRSIDGAAWDWMHDRGEEKLAAALPFIPQDGPR